MKMILNYIKEDFSRVQNNVIVLISILGLCIVPCLYAWFNIAASWDPYKNSQGIKVAIINQDKGYDLSLVEHTVNIGEEVEKELALDKDLDWVFTDQSQAIEGVKKGDYYAAIEIPKDFSEKMLNFLSPDTEQVRVKFYTNEKKNAIAPKVTDKEAGAIQKNISSIFLETLYKSALSSFEVLNKNLNQESSQALLYNLTNRLGDISSSLGIQVETLKNFQNLALSSQSIMHSTRTFLDSSSKEISSSISQIQESKEKLDETHQSIDHLNKVMAESIGSNIDSFTSISRKLNQSFEDLDDNSNIFSKDIDKLIFTLKEDQEEKISIKKKVADFNHSLPIPLLGLSSIEARLGQSILYEETIIDKLEEILEKKNLKQENILSIKKDIENLSQKNISQLNSLKEDFDKNILASIKTLERDFDSTRSSIDDLGKKIQGNSSKLVSLSKKMEDGFGTTAKNLDASIGSLESSKNELDLIQEKILDPKPLDKAQIIDRLIQKNPDKSGQLLSSPLEVKHHRLYPVENYGSSMASFYTTLSLWVGGIIIVAIMKVNTPSSYIEKYGPFKNYQMYLGRLFLFLFIGFIQSSLIGLGNLYFLEIQCLHPLHYLFACWISSFIYVTIIYTLSISFGDIGKALCVVLLVIQVAGSGGTFPIELAPTFFQKTYPLLPFVHSMNAMKESIAGFYQNTYWIELLSLLPYFIFSLLLGTVLRNPIIKYNKKFEEKLEDTKLI